METESELWPTAAPRRTQVLSQVAMTSHFVSEHCSELLRFRTGPPGLATPQLQHPLVHLPPGLAQADRLWHLCHLTYAEPQAQQGHQASVEHFLSIPVYQICSRHHHQLTTRPSPSAQASPPSFHTHVSDTAVVEQLRPCVLGLSNDSGLDSNLKITELTTEKETEPRAPQNTPVPRGEESDSLAASDETTDLMLTVTSSTEKLTDGEIHHELLQQAMEELPELNLEKHDGQGLGKCLSEVTVNEAASFVGGNLTDQPLGQDFLETWGGATVTEYLEGIQSNVEEDLSHIHDTENKVSSVCSTSTEPSLEALLFSLSEDSPEEITLNAEMQMDHRVLATGVEHQEDRETSLESPEKEQPLRMCPELFLTNETGPVTTGSDLKISLSTDEQLIDAKLHQSCELDLPHYEVPEAVLEDIEYGEESDSLAASDETTDLMLTVKSSTEKLTDGEIHHEHPQQAMEELPELNLEKHDGQGLECTFEPVPSMDEQFIDAENNQQGVPDHLQQHKDQVPEPIRVEHDSADQLLETSSRVHLEVLETIDSKMREAVYSEVPSVGSVSEVKMEMGHQVVLQQSTWEAPFESPEKEQAFRVSPELLIVHKDATETTGPAFDLVPSSDEELIDADIHQLGELENPELSLQKHDTGAFLLSVSDTSEEVSSPSSAGKEIASSSEAERHHAVVASDKESTHELLQAEEMGEKTFPSCSADGRPEKSSLLVIEALQTHDSEFPCLSGELGGIFPEAEMYMEHRVDHQEDSWEAPLETPEKEDSLIAALEQFLTDDGQTTTGSVYQMLQQLNKNEIHQENELEYLQHHIPEPRLEECDSGPPQDHHRAGSMWVVDHSQHCSDTDLVVVC
ncbi:hypothetical protein NFI96_000701 [Prochilodus magdalenae]|nr:hypothetical protein NFI96_000701 [Prochilodus magdalenae]